jgi:uncharacterized membrane protein YjgN (DUF898 family)
MRHTYFGSIQGSFTGTGWTLFKRGWWVWGLGMASILGALALLTHLDAIKAKNIDIFGGFILLLPIPIVLALLPLVMAIFTRWQMEGLRFGEVAVSSNLAKGAFYGTFLKLIFSSVGFLLVFGALFSLGSYLFVERLKALQAGEINWETGSVIALGALAYLALLLGMGIIQRYFMGRGLWAVVVNSITVSNLQAMNAAVAAGQPSGVLGEGLADALDFEIGI